MLKEILLKKRDIIIFPLITFSTEEFITMQKEKNYERVENNLTYIFFTLNDTKEDV